MWLQQKKEDTLFLHILNKQYSTPVKVSLKIEGYNVLSGVVHEIAPSDRLAYVDDARHDTFKPVDRTIANLSELTIPPASVSVIELQLKKL